MGKTKYNRIPLSNWEVCELMTINIFTEAMISEIEKNGKLSEDFMQYFLPVLKEKVQERNKSLEKKWSKNLEEFYKGS